MATFPVSPAPESIVLKSTQPTLVSVSHSLKQQNRSRGSQRWGISATYKGTRSSLAPLIAFALSKRGQYVAFDYIVPTLSDTRGTVTTTPTLTGTLSAGVRSVPVTGMGNTKTLKAGDLIRFANHTKTYMLTADVTSSAGGTGTLSIEPALYTSVPITTAVTVTDVPMNVVFAADTHDIGLSNSSIIEWSIELVEMT